MRYLRLIVAIALLPLVGNAQSKTDKVEDKLKGDKSSDSSEGSFVSFFFDIFVENLPELLYFQKFSAQEYSMHYNPYPYYSSPDGSAGLRSFYSSKPFSVVADVDVSRPPLTLVDTNYGFHTRINYDYWALDANYRLWDENGSTHYMHQFHVSLERKMRFFPNSEAGIAMGYQSVAIAGNLYQGMLFGFNSDYYWFRPISIQFNANALIFSESSATTIQTGLRYHFKNSSINLMYQSLDFTGIVYRGVNIGYTVYF